MEHKEKTPEWAETGDDGPCLPGGPWAPADALPCTDPSPQITLSVEPPKDDGDSLEFPAIDLPAENDELLPHQLIENQTRISTVRLSIAELQENVTSMIITCSRKASFFKYLYSFLMFLTILLNVVAGILSFESFGKDGMTYASGVISFVAAGVVGGTITFDMKKRLANYKRVETKLRNLSVKLDSAKAISDPDKINKTYEKYQSKFNKLGYQAFVGKKMSSSSSS